MLYIIVTGTREAKYGFWWKEIVDAFHEHAKGEQFVLIHGGAKGIDSIADHEARKICDQDPIIFPAAWSRHGNAAGPIRNQMMADFGSNRMQKGDEVICLAFHDAFHEKTGTANMIGRAHAAGIPVYRYFRD